jgi:hypothetical protein
MRYSGKPCRLTREQVAELKAAYAVYQANHPLRLAERYGISRAAIHMYLNDKHKIGAERRAASPTGVER